MSLEEVGEKELLLEIQKLVGEGSNATLLGIGDDAAVVRLKGSTAVVTTDIFTEWVHFRVDHISPDQLGAKALAATVSDCAAMGCAPRWVTVALAAPKETGLHRVLSIYRGLRDAAEGYGCDLVGGDTVRSLSDLSLTLTAVGEPYGEKIFTRSGAEGGDDLFVTGALGGAMAGLALLHLDPQLSLKEEYRSSMFRYLAPEARVDVSKILATRFPVTSMIDVSDGLSVELHHLARASGVGFHVESGAVPILPSALEASSVLEIPIETLVYQGGEEYELLFTATPGHDDEIIEEISRETGVSVARIGTVMPAEEGVLLVHPDGEEERLSEEGYEHFGP